MNNHNISVYGSTGFIGSRFTGLYSRDVVKVDRDVNIAPTNNLLYFISTVDNYNIHNNVHIDIDTNLSKLMDVIQANKRQDVIFNFISSWFVYGQNTDLPFNEDKTVCKPTGFYSITKKCAEEMIICFCNTFNIKYRILRLSNVLGEGDTKISRKKNALQFLIREAVNNRDIHLYYGGEVIRDYIYVDDVCRALKICVDTAPVNQIINIGSGKPYKFLDIIETAIEKAGSASRIINIEPTTFHNIVQTKHSYLDTAKLRSYGFKLNFTIEQIVERLVNHYRNIGQ